MLRKEPGFQFPDRLEAYIAAFEAAWDLNETPDWFQHVSKMPEGQAELLHQVVFELTAIDIELRWKRGMGRLIEEYFLRESRLNEMPILLELVVEEFRARLRCLRRI